jgi:nicotinamidase-related amidase
MNTLTYPVNESALILVDVLNEFLAEDGKLHEAIAPMLEKTQLIRNLQRLLDGARAQGLKVFFSPHGLDAHSFDDVAHVHPRFQMAIDQQMFWKGGHGDEFFAPLQPRPHEFVVSHHRMFSSFHGTDLQTQLQREGIRKIIIAGLTSQTCVEGTGRDALEAGYHVTFIKDAVADFTEAAHRAALEVAYPTFGHETLTVDEFLVALDTADGSVLGT